MKLIPDSGLYHQYFSDSNSGIEVLSENEKRLTQSFSSKRMREFCSGRHCAHKALEAYGMSPNEVLIKNNGAPLWPDSTIGSISHSGELCGAIVSRSSLLTSIGLDIETIGEVKDELWPILFTPAELNWLNGISAEKQKILATILFSMKECTFKLQYAITGTMIEFTDAEISEKNSHYIVKSVRDFENRHLLPEFLPINYVQTNGQIVTWAIL